MKQRSRSRRWVVPLVVLVVAIPAFRYCQPPQRSVPLSADRPTIPTHAELYAARSGQALTYSEHGLDLVFEGGGAKGLAHVGAIREFEQRGLRYRRIAGTSAGALVAMFVAAGLTGDEIRAAITQRMPDGTIVMGSFLVVPETFDEQTVRNSLAFRTLTDLDLPEAVNTSTLDLMLKIRAFREAFSLVEYGGLVAGDDYLAWIKGHLNAASEGLGDATFSEFYRSTGAELTIVAADMDTGNLLMLNHRTAPDLPVALAARMSSSVPFAFRNVRWQASWGDYLGSPMVGHRIVDGGVASNLPILLMLADTDTMISAMGAQPDRQRIMGFLLDEKLDVPGLAALKTEHQGEEDPVSRHWDQALGRAHKLVETLMKAQDNFLISMFPGLVCRLPANGFSSLQYDMADAEVDALVDAAQASTRTCLSGMNADTIAQAIAPEKLAPVAAQTEPETRSPPSHQPDASATPEQADSAHMSPAQDP